MKQCTIETCGLPTVSRNLCSKHYTRFRKGKPLVKALNTSNWTDTNIAWLAGIIEGEGTFTIRKGGLFTTIKVVSTDYDVIDKIHSIVEGKINGPYKRDDLRKSYKVWSLHESYPQQELMKKILPWMGKRRSARIKKCLKILEKALKTSKNPYA